MEGLSSTGLPRLVLKSNLNLNLVFTLLKVGGASRRSPGDEFFRLPVLVDMGKSRMKT